MRNTSFKNTIRDWKIAISVFGIGLVSLTVFGWWIYLGDKIARGYLVPQIEKNSILTKTFDEKKLKADLLILENRQLEFLRIKNDKPKLVDPSL